MAPPGPQPTSPLATAHSQQHSERKRMQTHAQDIPNVLRLHLGYPGNGERMDRRGRGAANVAGCWERGGTREERGRNEGGTRG